MGIEVVFNDVQNRHFENQYRDNNNEAYVLGSGGSDSDLVRGALAYATQCRANNPSSYRNSRNYDSYGDEGGYSESSYTIGAKKPIKTSKAEAEEIKKAADKELAENQKAYLKVTKELEKKEETKKADDKEELGFWGKAKSFGKGATKLVTGMFCDEKGFSLKRTLITGATIVGAAVLCAAVPVAAPILLGIGAVMGGYRLLQGASKASEAKTKEEKQKAWEDIGEGMATVAAAYFGARSLSKAKPIRIKRSLEKVGEGLSKGSNIENAVAAEISSLGKGRLWASKKDTQNAIRNIRSLTEKAQPDSYLDKVGAELTRLTAKKPPINATARGEIAEKTAQAAQELKQAEQTLKTATSTNKRVPTKLKQQATEAQEAFDSYVNTLRNTIKKEKRCETTSEMQECIRLKTVRDTAQKSLTTAKTKVRNQNRQALESVQQAEAEVAAKAKLLQAYEGVQNAGSKDEAANAIQALKTLLGEASGDEAKLFRVRLEQAEHALGERTFAECLKLNTDGLSRADLIRNGSKKHTAIIGAGIAATSVEVQNNQERLTKEIKEAEEKAKKQALAEAKIALHAKNFEVIARQAESYGLELPDLDKINSIEDKDKQDEAIQKATKELQAKIDKYHRKHGIKGQNKTAA